MRNILKYSSLSELDTAEYVYPRISMIENLGGVI